MRAIYVVVAVLYAALPGSVDGADQSAASTPVDSYTFADIAWGSTPEAARRVLREQGYIVEIQPNTGVGSAISFTSTKEFGFEYEVSLGFEMDRGLIAVAVVTVMDCMAPSDQDCYEARFFGTDAFLRSLYGEPSENIPFISSKWTNSQDGSIIDLNRMIGIMYSAPDLKEALRKKSIF